MFFDKLFEWFESIDCFAEFSIEFFLESTIRIYGINKEKCSGICEGGQRMDEKFIT